VVLLDARRGKYSLVPGDRARALEGVVQGWPALRTAEIVAGGPAQPPSSLLESLISSGVLVPVRKAASIQEQEFERAPVMVAKQTLLDALAARENTKIHFRHWATFSLSVAYAAVMLKCRPFEAVIHDLRSRKQRRGRLVAEPPITAIREYVRAFSWLRPFGYAQSDACLFDSVALTDFLYRQGVFADFLIGVRVRPFAAHSWVQAQGFACNDVPEYLGEYSPILWV
jgi:hypothetical protein